ncbi:hypothetical protein CH063_13983 [Colletotrichum higginsianum]|uniref:Uncharacterized protein n=1 Tax=Colletotrichum higginsianum (strain IMI 349063) TaxID=759273 RepID=H1VWN7_COLHI|nr:hypothetical protein CH063_13983 [Colletotrichum higginsianum]
MAMAWPAATTTTTTTTTSAWKGGPAEHTRPSTRCADARGASTARASPARCTRGSAGGWARTGDTAPFAARLRSGRGRKSTTDGVYMVVQKCARHQTTTGQPRRASRTATDGGDDGEPRALIAGGTGETMKRETR